MPNNSNMYGVKEKLGLTGALGIRQAAIVPLAGLTAALALFCNLGLPSPLESNDRNQNTT